MFPNNPCLKVAGCLFAFWDRKSPKGCIGKKNEKPNGLKTKTLTSKAKMF